MPQALPAGRIPAAVPLIERRIYVIRGQKVMLASDLAEIYQVPTKRLNEAVKRNLARFPEDFMFQLNNEELENWRSQIATSNPAAKMGIRRPPYAFTEHGVAMLSAVLNSDHAIRMSILIVRAFVKLRELLAGNKDLALRIEQIEAGQNRHAETQEQQTRTLQQHTSILISVVEDIQKLKNPPITRAIGFVPRSPKKR
jgi:hypothetical protein